VDKKARFLRHSSGFRQEPEIPREGLHALDQGWNRDRGSSSNTESPTRQAELLTQAKLAGRYRTHKFLNRLQRHYGNQQVQRVLRIAKKAQSSSEMHSGVEQAVTRKRGSGRALGQGVQAQMESLLDADFSDVRVHTDRDADGLNRQLNARAFTTGQDIFFREGAYSPGSSGGRQLLAHEFTHVSRQACRLNRKMTLGQPGDIYERDADEAARALMQQKQRANFTGPGNGKAQRQPSEKNSETLATKFRAVGFQRQAKEKGPKKKATGQAKQEVRILKDQTGEEKELQPRTEFDGIQRKRHDSVHPPQNDDVRAQSSSASFIIQLQPLGPAQQDWQAFARIRAHYGNLAAYRRIRNQVAGWNNPNVANPGRFINTALGEWNANRRVRRHFGGGFDGGQNASYLNIKRLFRRRGIPNPANYIVTNIVGIRFFNIRTSGHRALRAALNNAAAVLRASGFNFVLVPSGAFVPRTVRGTVNSLSNHALGRAIDFDAPRNPLMTNRAVFRVIDEIIRPIFRQRLLAIRDPVLLRVASVYYQQAFNAWQARQVTLLRHFRSQRQYASRFVAQARRTIRQTNRLLGRLRRRLRRARGQRRQQLQAAIGQQQTRLWMLQRMLSLALFYFRIARAATRNQQRLVRSINRNRATLTRLARQGFMNLPLPLVWALQNAGLDWGGAWRTRKDFMHFQIP
jgi:hypothetical protein